MDTKLYGFTTEDDDMGVKFNGAPFGGHHLGGDEFVHCSLLRWFSTKIHSQGHVYQNACTGSSS